jgi:hypothetical protein
MRIIILLLIVELFLFSFFNGKSGIVLIPSLIAAILLIPVFVRMKQLGSINENFTNQTGFIDDSGIQGMTAIPSGSAIDKDSIVVKEMKIGETVDKPWTEPTPNNPFMNLLVTDYKDSPNKPAAISKSNPIV